MRCTSSSSPPRPFSLLRRVQKMLTSGMKESGIIIIIIIIIAQKGANFKYVKSIGEKEDKLVEEAEASSVGLH